MKREKKREREGGRLPLSVLYDVGAAEATLPFSRHTQQLSSHEAEANPNLFHTDLLLSSLLMGVNERP